MRKRVWVSRRLRRRFGWLLVSLAGNVRQDLLVAIASTRPLGYNPHGNSWWGNTEFVGVFEQERQDPAQIFELALLPPAKPEELGQIRIRRATRTELVLARTPEQGRDLETIEMIFDLRQKKLIRQIHYAPFIVRRIIQGNGVPTFVMTDLHASILIRPNATGGRFDVIEGPPYGSRNHSIL